MTTKILKGHYPSGYTLSNVYSGVSLTASAYLQGSGLVTSGVATVTNAGTIHATAHYDFAGIHLMNGGVVTNSGVAWGSVGYRGPNGDFDGDPGGKGGAGLRSEARATVTNTGSIYGGSGGSGGSGIYGGAGGAGGAGVQLLTFGYVINDSGTIRGGHGGAGGDRRGQGGAGGAGIYLKGGGAVLVNGGAVVGGAGGAGGFGAYDGPAGADGAGVLVSDGGDVFNHGLISGGVGVYDPGHGLVTVVNFGTIAGSSGTAILFRNSEDTLTVEPGAVFIGSVVGAGGQMMLQPGTGAIGALGTAFTGFGSYRVFGGSWTLTGTSSLGADQTLYNSGTLTGSFDFAPGASLVAQGGSKIIGAVAGGGGTLELATATGTISGLGAAGAISGSESMTFSGFGSYVFDPKGAWTLAGYDTLAANQTLTNYGTLSVAGALANLGSLTSAGGDGVTLTAGGSVANGANGLASAIIEGAVGVYAGGAGAVTVDNFGTIAGTGGVAVQFQNAADLLIVEAGSAWVGAAQGGGGTLELNGGGGTIVGLGGAGSLSGPEALDFSGFGAYEIKKGAWTLAGTDLLAKTAAFAVKGKLVNTGALDLAGAVTGSGSLVFAGGTETIGSRAKLTVSTWSVTGGAASIEGDLVYAGTFSQGAGAATTLAAGDSLDLTGSAALAGVINGDGTLSVAGATLKALTLGGTATLTVTGSASQIGAVTVGDASASAATLVVAAGATYAIAGPFALAQGATAGSSLSVLGTFIRSGAAGTCAVGLATDDSGMIEVLSGTLDFTNALTGSGALSIGTGATLEADSTAAAALTLSFAGDGGVLASRNPAGFAATIADFAATDAIDLLKVKANLAVLGPGDTLVIYKGAATVATLQLSGDYADATFATASDGHGGTSITVSGGGGATPPPTEPPKPHAFIAAAASFAAGFGSAHATPTASLEYARLTLAAPRPQAA